jgi:diguanylate cyclase (GGDEF)-like protein/PAS domain S-box-containing protein
MEDDGVSGRFEPERGKGESSRREATEEEGARPDDERLSVEEATRMRLERAARQALEHLGEGRAEASGERTTPLPGPNALDDPRTLAAVLEAAPSAIILFDAYGEIADWSPAAERLLGHSRSRAVGRDLLELIFPGRLHRAIRGVIDNRGAGWGDAEHRSIEVAVLTSDGEEIPAELSLSWAPGSGLFAAHLHDRRERSQRERELAAEARRRSRLLELGQVALRSAGRQQVMQATLATAIEEIDLASCEIWECRDGGLTLRARRGEGPELGTEVRPAPGSRIAEALRAGVTRVVTGDRLLPSPWLAPEHVYEHSTAGIAAILSSPTGVLGILSGTCAAERRFSGAETEFLESIAQILASAIERDRFNASLASAESRLRTLVERLPAITYRADLGSNGHWHYISPQVEEILGYSPEECTSDDQWWEKLVHPDDLARVLAEEERAASEGLALDVAYRMRARDGRELWIRDRASIGSSIEGSVVVEGILSDVTAQVEAEHRLRHLVDHDHLTGLLNRRGFEAAVDGWLDSTPAAGRGALAIIDVDHLKRVNDSLGHAAGDALLREISTSIRRSLRAGDVLGRLSGDEFGLFIPGIDQEAATRRLGQLIDLVRVSGSGRPAITASAGATTVVGGDALRAADLLVHADIALYHAKEGGRDRVAFADEQDNERLRWVGEVRDAIESERLALYAQPIFDLASGHKHGSELLVRMIGRDGDVVSAGQFIPTAERFGLIRQVDRWVVARAVDIAARGERVSVNISAASIADHELTDLVAARLDAAGDVDPALIIFEITETVATPTIEILRRFAERVERIGCGLSLDDVGTGFGTLTYLQNLRFSELKIDMSFVQAMLDSANDAGIVRSLIVIARELGLRTVAEGVESAEVVDRLREMGVDQAQGYYLGRPAPVELDD